MITDTRGLDFVRVAIAKACVPDANAREHVGVAESRWGSGSVPARILRAAVNAATVSDPSWAGPLSDSGAAGTEFLSLVRERSVLGRLDGARKVAPQTRAISMGTGVSTFWVGAGKSIPVTSAALSINTLPPLKIASQVVTTKELLRLSDPDAEAALRDDMVAAAAEALDATMFDPANAGVTDIMPAAVTHGAPSVTASNYLKDDLKDLIAAFDGDLSRAYFVANPETLALFSGADRPNVGARGGEMMGVPALPSRKVPVDILTLIDAGGVAFASEDPIVRVSTQASVEMNDTPDSPATASTILVSLFQKNLVAIQLTQIANWTATSGAVAVMTGLANLGDSP